MVWVTPVTVAEVRAECSLIKASLVGDIDTAACITESEGEIEATVLRGRYSLTDPSADVYTRRSCLDLVCAKLLGRIYGNEGWVKVEGDNLVASGLFTYYYGRYKLYAEGVVNGSISLTLTRITIPPEVYNEPLGTAERSQYDLDSKADYGLDLVVSE
jgi:hypothetical protein